MYATAGDLARFVRMSLYQGGLIFPKRVIEETQSPQIHLKRKFARYDRFAYGLGWYLADYDADLLIHHFGGFRGAQAHMSFMPDRGLGVVVLTNTDAPLAHSIASFVYDSLLKKGDAQKRLDEDVQHFIEQKAKRAESLKTQVEKALANVSDSKERAADGTYVGDYGTMIVKANTIAIGAMHSTLVHAKGASYVVYFAPDEPTIVTFKGNSLNWDGQEFGRR